jgi:hypothetical protein
MTVRQEDSVDRTSQAQGRAPIRVEERSYHRHLGADVWGGVK